LETELVTGVVLDADGAPACFTWRNAVFLTTSRPVRWYSRSLWWQHAGQAHPGQGQNLVETEMWRLWAASPDNRYFFQLRHQMPGDNWEIEQATP